MRGGAAPIILGRHEHRGARPGPDQRSAPCDESGGGDRAAQDARPAAHAAVLPDRGLPVEHVVGLVLVLAFHGARVSLGGSTFTALVDLVAGVAALAFAIGYRRGRLSMPRRERRVRSANGAGARLAQRLRNPSVLEAAVAGVATHIPGLIYVVALNAIAAGEPATVSAAVQVAIYNALWFMVPIAALALAILRPGRAPEYLELATRWGRQHEQILVVVTLAGLGVYLTIKGLVRLF